MSSLKGVRKLPDHFMHFYTGVTSVQLPPNVEELGNFFLCKCTLTAVDMSSLTGVGKLPTTSWMFFVNVTSRNPRGLVTMPRVLRG